MHLDAIGPFFMPPHITMLVIPVLKCCNSCRYVMCVKITPVKIEYELLLDGHSASYGQPCLARKSAWRKMSPFALMSEISIPRILFILLKYFCNVRVAGLSKP